jgi:hypothetical protein
VCLQERIKRGYKNKNDDDDEDEADLNALTGAGRALKKLVQKAEKNDAYDSDDEGDPYNLVSLYISLLLAYLAKFFEGGSGVGRGNSSCHARGSRRHRSIKTCRATRQQRHGF